jgi:hypothetical protein
MMQNCNYEITKMYRRRLGKLQSGNHIYVHQKQQQYAQNLNDLISAKNLEEIQEIEKVSKHLAKITVTYLEALKDSISKSNFFKSSFSSFLSLSSLDNSTFEGFGICFAP